MKIIDLLNKIANGEEVPKKIYCFNREFYLKGNTYFGDAFTLMHYIQEENLTNEVEIIEEEKKIPENLEIINSNCHVEDCYYENLSKEEIALDLVTLKNWINSIIDYLKSKGE